MPAAVEAAPVWRSERPARVALPKRHRLRSHRAIDHLHRQGRRHQSPHLLLRVVAAKDGLLPPPDRRAPGSPWRCALVISAKVNKRAVVRNRLRRLLHRHLLATLQRPAAAADGSVAPRDPTAPGPAAAEEQPAGEMALGLSEPPAPQHGAGSPPARRGLASPVASASAPAAAFPGPAGAMAGQRAERDPQPAAAGRLTAVHPNLESPIWLMVSLRPGSADLNADQLLGECTFVLRRAGLIP